MTRVAGNRGQALVDLSVQTIRSVTAGVLGVAVPTLVVLLGSIGGVLAAGIIGLFVGAVILVLGYEMLRAWTYQDSVEESSAQASNPA